MIRLLTFTNLYPSESRTRHGIFVEQRLRHLVETGRVEACVVVPTPAGPFQANADGGREQRHGIPVRYCRFPAVRGLTTVFHPRLMARCVREAVTELRAEYGDFDIIDAQFLYPDGVAGVHLGQWLRRPVTLTARGSDVNVALRERIAGHGIRWAAQRSAAIISVSNTLRDSMVEQGLPAERITVLRNGVDLEVFRPGDRARLRAELEIDGPTLLSVGNLVPEKAHELLLETLQCLPDARAIVIGSGPLAGALKASALQRGIAARVRWLDPIPQAALQRYYAAADLTVLTSLREGMPNVVLESLACGTPVVSMAVGGATEVLTSAVAGRLVYERSAELFADACRTVIESPPATAEVRRFGERFGWAQPITEQVALYERIAGRS